MDVENRLRQTRERQGLTLRQVSDVTKLSMTTLRRLEGGEFEALPGGILIKGYLRAYAAAVGLAPEEIVREYLAQHAERITPEPAAASPPSRRRVVRPALSAAAVVIVAVVVGYWWPLRSGDSVERSPTQTPAVAAAAVADAADRGAAPMTAQEFRLVLDIRAADVCWVSISGDGRRAIHRLFMPGDRASVTADEQLVLRIGEPAALVYHLNGVRGRQLGQPGQPVTVTITRENYQSFFALDSGAARSVAAKLT
jgi:transcriptional regulator with XRE-family HTH domain